ncbi:antibiotic biosynthesis monooxygenase [Kitasatospora kazusensis]|uniref:putative quinol monooxygenase n=1 Tax=Kitasatospora kazusensis TaxID=407974 RepID=UPI0031E0ACD5
MAKVALLARIVAKPEHAAEVEALLRGALPLAEAESGTVTWSAFREDDVTFGVFDTFEDEHGRAAHLEGSIAAALMGIAATHLAAPPDIRRVDLLAVKLP